MKKILITGGAGYIGSHLLIELAKAGYEFIVFDNFSNASSHVLSRVEKLIGKKILSARGDIRNKASLQEIFEGYPIDSVIHLASLKAVGESVEKPLEYYDHNIIGTIRLLEVMQEYGCKKFVFSSTSTVYGEPKFIPITESASIGETTSPYSTSKYMIERILEDRYISDKSFKLAILRYFNPIGAHKSGMIGEDPCGIPNNLMPFLTQVAVGKREYLSVFGGDYDTHDGTGVRDYLHVVDLAKGHTQALSYLDRTQMTKPLVMNLGTGVGYSVLDVIKAFEKASGKTIPYKIVGRRAGDIAKYYADATYAKEILGWEAEKSLEQMCRDSWNWQSQNPNGYQPNEYQ